jgi:hypothetical protein
MCKVRLPSSVAESTLRQRHLAGTLPRSRRCRRDSRTCPSSSCRSLVARVRRPCTRSRVREADLVCRCTGIARRTPSHRRRTHLVARRRRCSFRSRTLDCLGRHRRQQTRHRHRRPHLWPMSRRRIGERRAQDAEVRPHARPASASQRSEGRSSFITASNKRPRTPRGRLHHGEGDRHFPAIIHHPTLRRATRDTLGNSSRNRFRWAHSDWGCTHSHFGSARWRTHRTCQRWR